MYVSQTLLLQVDCMEKNKMTEAKVNLSCDTKSEFFQWAKELEQLAQAGLKKELATSLSQWSSYFLFKTRCTYHGTC